MTKVQFYLIETDNAGEQFTYALQLAMQLLANGKHLHIHTRCADDTQQMQKLLADHVSHGGERLSIDHHGEPADKRDTLLNLSTEVPYFFSSFESTLEVICTGSDGKDAGRERYRYYKSRGYPLRHCEVAPQLAL